MSDKVKHVSASSIAAFKACPQRYRLGYVEGIRQAVEAQPLRFGTAWHKGLEILEFPVGTQYITEDNAPGGCIVTNENRLDLAIQAATEAYETVPDGVDPTDWAVEREILANALAAYHWLYGTASEYETVATELQFDLPLVNPETGHPTPNFRRVGKIDRIIRHKGSGRLLIQENKTTSRPIDSGSTYWDRLRKDTQSKFYITAARDLDASGTVLVQGQEVPMRLSADGQVVSGLLHDVFHKPAIKPKKLTQAESTEFVKTGEYCGQTFNVDGSKGPCCYEVDGVCADVEQGAEPKPKKDGTCAPRPFAIRETPGMFGARLLEDMTTTDDKHNGPAYYFARREIAFTDAELADFQYQVWALQKTMAEMERTGHWYENEGMCEATGTFKCSYCPLCYNNVACCDGVTVPPGFRRLHAETVEQTPTEVQE
jgi:hypothetical protein